MQYYYLLAQGDESKDTFAGTIQSLEGTKYLAQAYKLGLKVR